jgi:hypothetical protein
MCHRLTRSTETEEGLHYPAALTIYCRNRFISNLLPHIQRATALRRVVTTFAGGWEGQIDMDDFEGYHISRFQSMGHNASIVTLALEGHHKAAPEVSYVHNFPGSVKSGIDRGDIGLFMRTMKTIFKLFAPLLNIPLEVSGDRHVFLCTSARYSNGPEDKAAGVPLVDGLELAEGIDGQRGSGVYTVDETGESKRIETDTKRALDCRKDG